MNWVVLLAAGLLEVVWAVAMKFTSGWTRFWPSVLTLTAMAASFALLAEAMKTIPISTAYAVWVGIGAVGVALAGMIWLGEPRTAWKLVCLGMIVAGVIGLRLGSA